MSQPPRRPALRDIEVLRDEATTRRPDEGFLHLQRLVLVNLLEDGTRSAPYPCDLVSRARPDAVAVAVWGRDGAGRVHVVLRENLRPPVWLRQRKAFTQPDTRTFLLLGEVVAGLLEPEDTGPTGIERRGAIEVAEEVGWRVEPASLQVLGGPLFASPGFTDEKIHFRHVQVDLSRAGLPSGDGSIMEQAGQVQVVLLDEALERCRSGVMPDMKTEVALARLAGRLAGR